MEVESAKIMVEEITVKRRMTPEVKEGLKKRILHNLFVAIGIILYIVAINIVYIKIPQNTLEIALKVFSIFSIIATIITFEIAYKKDSGIITIVGIEFLFMSIFVLYIPQIYLNFEKTFSLQFAIVPIFCIIYYIVKMCVIYIKTKKNYQNNLSDVKDILNEEE